jgi:hypothetical protein
VAGRFGLFTETIGNTAAEVVEIKVDGRVVVSAPIHQLRDGFERALESALKADPALVAAD